MRLQNYWWLLIWPILFGAVSAAFIPKREELVLGKREVRWNWLPALIMALPYVIWAAWRPGNIGDTGLYRKLFSAAPSGFSALGSFVAQQSKDKGFAVFEVLFKTLVSKSDIFFFFFIAAFQLLCLVLVFRKYSCNYWLSFFFFVASTDYISWMQNGMRQFIAVAMIFAVLPLLVKRKYLSVILVVLLAYTFHASALIFLPFIFIVQGKPWNWKTILFIAGVIISILFVEELTGLITTAMEDTAYEGDIVYFLNDDGTNIFRVLFYSVPAIMSLIFRRRIESADDPMISICVNLSVAAAGIYVVSHFTSGILVGRLPIYFSLANYILVPWLIREAFNRESALFLNVVFAGAYTVFFYYQMHFGWGMI